MQSLLEGKGITKTFGGVHAVKEVSFQLREGEIFSMIGPNGAGKTTLFNCITGLYVPTAGTIMFQCPGGLVDLAGLPVHRITSFGLARTFQNIRLFWSMTAIENVMVGGFIGTSSGFIAGLFRSTASRQEEERSARAAHDLLDFMGMAPRANDLASHLSYGDRRRVEIARAMASHPKILLLDEPAAGMNPRETADLIEVISRIRSRGITVILIEHDMKVVMGISDRVMVLHDGECIAEGTPAFVRNHPQVIEAYLGVTAQADRL